MEKRGEAMKRSSLWLLLALLVSGAGIGFAERDGRVIDGIHEKTVALAIDGERLIWADDAQPSIGIYNFASGKRRTVALKTTPHTLRLAGGMIFFLGSGKAGDSSYYPYYCECRSAKTYQLDTTPALGLEADEKYIVWYNHDRIILHQIQTGRRWTIRADQTIRDAAVSQDTLVYIDGMVNRKNTLYVVNLRNGEKKSYAFMNIGDLALEYPLVALASDDETAGKDGKAVYIVNLGTEHVIAIEHTYYPELFNSDDRYGLDMARSAVAFRSTPDPAQISSEIAQGVYLYDVEQNKLMNLSPRGVRPVLSDERVAWVENGGIYVYKYR